MPEKTEEHSPAPQLSRGIYGFVFCISIILLIVSYFAWMLMPADWVKSWPYEPPQPYWGLAVPVYFCTVLFLFAFCIYPALHSRHDCELDEQSAITDPYSLPPDYFAKLKKTQFNYQPSTSPKCTKSKSHNRNKSRTWSVKDNLQSELQHKLNKPEEMVIETEKPILPVSDMDLDTVCRMLYLASDE